MNVEVTAGDPHAVGADLIAAAGARAAELGAPERAVAEADPVAMVYPPGAPVAVVALDPGADGLRTGAARAIRACRDGGTVAWALDASLPVPVEDQVRALAEGAVIGGGAPPAGGSRGRSTRRCPFPSRTRCARSPKAPSSAGTPAAGGEAAALRAASSAS